MRPFLHTIAARLTGRSQGRLLAISLVVVAALVVHGQLLLPNKVPYSAQSDFVLQGLAVKQTLWSEIGASPRPPAWRDDVFSGAPAASNPQSQYLFPSQILFWLMPPVEAFGPTAWLHFVLFALSFWVLGAVIRLSWQASVLCALAGLGFFRLIAAVHVGWLPVLPEIALLPALLAAIVSFFKKPSLRSALVLGGVAGLHLFSGRIQLCYYMTLVAAPFEIGALARTSLQKRRVCWTELGLLSLSVLVAALLAAPVLLPLAVDASQMARAKLSYTFFLSGNGLGLSDWSTFFLPELLGSPFDTPLVDVWEKSAFFGSAPLLLATFALFLRKRDARVSFFAACFALSLALTLDSPWLRFLFNYLPGFSLFRCPSRFLTVTGVFGVALAGIGYDSLHRILANRSRRLGVIFFFVIAGLILLEGRHYSRRYITMAPTRVADPELPLARFLRREPRPFRLAPIQRATFNYGWAARHHLQLVTGFDTYQMWRYRRYMTQVEGERGGPELRQPWIDLNGVARSDLLDELSVRYILSSARLPHVEPFLEEVAYFARHPSYRALQGATATPLHVYRNKGQRPWIWPAAQVKTLTSARQAERALRTKRPGEAIIEGELPQWFRRGLSPPAQSSYRVHILYYRAGRLRASISTPQDHFFVISEIWHPGWIALVDGKPATLHPTNLALMGLAIPAGNHEVLLFFKTPFWSLSWAFFALGCVLVLGGVGLVTFAKTRGNQRQIAISDCFL